MATLVTLTARDVVRDSVCRREAVQRETLRSLRDQCQQMMGVLSVRRFDQGTVNYACLVGDKLCTEAIAVLPREWSNPFMQLAVIPRLRAEFDSWIDLRLFFDRVFNATACFDGDDPEVRV